jgi:GT2 family glycosyltransferase
MSKLLSIITVSYNSQDFIEKYLKSVLKYKPANSEVIVLDNCSSDETARVLEDYQDKITLIRSEENLGFAKGNNKAVNEGASGDYLFFLNPDTELTGDIFPELIKFYESDKNMGLVGTKLILPDGATQQSVKKLPTIWGAFKEYILGIKHAYSQYIPKGDNPQEVDCIYGAAMLIRRELFNNVGGFNEKYFLYYEDVDFCRKIKNIHKKIFYYPLVSIKHLVGAAKSTQDRGVLNQRSAKIYHGTLGLFFLNLIFLVPRLRRRLRLG